jgi:tetratricopeptide (TPR) repeat protein
VSAPRSERQASEQLQASGSRVEQRTSGPGGDQQASGSRSVAASQISGMVVTGDDARIDARAPVLGTGIPRPADVTAATGMHNLPRPPAAVFVGRADMLARLERGLADGTSVVVTQAVFGLGGVGKSELALQHAHTHHRRYPLTWWITADEPGKVEAGLAALAARVCPDLALAATTTEAAAWALTWLQAHPGWLLILDDVSDPADIGPLLGQLHGGHILLTTRRDTGWQRIAAPMRLDLLAPAPAAALITSAIEQASPADEQTAAEIAAELGYLPLALDQAAAYIAQARITLPRYLELLREHPVRLYAAIPVGGQAQRTIARLWDITLQTITQTAPEAAGLLRVLSCYAPDNIPRRIIGGPDPGPEQDEALALLASYSMITLTADTVSMHKLVQAVLLAAPTDTADAPTPRDTALNWLDDAMPADPDSNVAAWPFLRALAPHVEAVATRYRAGEEGEFLARVLNQIALFYQSQGAYRIALTLRTACLNVAVRIFGDEDRRTATYLGNLAATYSALGRDGEALPLAERALAVTEAALGADHPDTAFYRRNLAAGYRAVGRDADAMALERHRDPDGPPAG